MKHRTLLSALLTAAAAWTAVAQPRFSQPHGLYGDTAFSVAITPRGSTSEIRYTLDGSEPTAASPLYTAPIAVSRTTLLRAVEVAEGGALSDVATASYLFTASVLAQDNAPAGYPAQWGRYAQISGTAPADYEMDPEMTSNPALRPLIEAGLWDLPTLSLVTDRDHFFNKTADPDRGGIYIYTGPPVGDGTGRGWTRPVSAELIGGPQGHDLTVDCAIKMHGGHSRLAEKNPKHSLRLVFKSDYGPSKLDYPLFGPDYPQTFNALVLRCHFGNSWQHWNPPGRPMAQYTRDLWARAMQARLGHPAVAGLYVHLFINGLYWGIYNIAERVDDQYGKAHFGGKKSDYDVISVDEQAGNAVEASEGTLDAWREMQSAVAAVSASNHAALFRLEGKDADGRDDPDAEALLDLDGLIDYMLINQYGGNTDWDHHNWLAIRRRGAESRGFHFLCWDTEQIFESLDDNVLGLNTAGNPTGLFNRLVKNPIFLHRYMDRAHALLTSGGALSPQGVVAVWDSLYNVIRTALYDEAARWGDYRRDVHPYASRGDLYTVDGHYQAERQRLLTAYFPQRSDRLLAALRAKGWYPSTEAPRFVLNGDATAALPDTLTPGTDRLTLSGPYYIIYTADGSAPVEWRTDSRGRQHPDAVRYAEGEDLLADAVPDADGRVTLRAIARYSNEWSAAVAYTFVLSAPSGIEATAADAPPRSASAVYDLTGRRVASALHDGLPAGLYIADGRKVCVRP